MGNNPSAPGTTADIGPTIGINAGRDPLLALKGWFEGRFLRAHSFDPAGVDRLAPATTQPSSASGGLGGQNTIGPPTTPNRTVPGASADPRRVQQEEYPLSRAAAIAAQLMTPPGEHPGVYSVPHYWRDQRYPYYQDDPSLPDISTTATSHTSDVVFASGGVGVVPPVRIARLNKRAVSAWQGIQQWGYQQSNYRLNMRPGDGRLASHATRGTRSVSGVKNALVQGSGTRHIPAIFVPTSVS